MPTADQVLAQIKEIVANTDEHRTRARRESWDTVKDALAQPVEEAADADRPERPDGRSTVDAWREYAAAIGVDVAEDATKADIRAAVEEADDADGEG
jgi:hypothetical protein